MAFNISKKKHRVILVHDFAESNRRGLIKTKDEKYLLSFSKFKACIEASIKNGIIFEKLFTNYEKKNFIQITSDDGGGSALLLANFLKDHGIKGIFFIITSKIGCKDFLNYEEIKYIHSMGHQIGSHSHTHPNPFCKLNKEEIAYEIYKSREILEELLNDKITTFSVPGGECTKSTLLTISREGFNLKEIYTSTPFQGEYFRNLNSVFYGRLCIFKSMRTKEIIRIINGEGWTLKRIRYQAGRFKREREADFRKLNSRILIK